VVLENLPVRVVECKDLPSSKVEEATAARWIYLLLRVALCLNS